MAVLVVADDLAHLPHRAALPSSHDQVLLHRRKPVLLLSLRPLLVKVDGVHGQDNHNRSDDEDERYAVVAVVHLEPAPELANVPGGGAGKFLDDGDQETRDELVTVRQIAGEVADVGNILHPVFRQATPNHRPRFRLPARVDELGQVEFAPLLDRHHPAVGAAGGSSAAAALVPDEIAHGVALRLVGDGGSSDPRASTLDGHRDCVHAAELPRSGMSCHLAG